MFTKIVYYGKKIFVTMNKNNRNIGLTYVYRFNFIKRNEMRFNTSDMINDSCIKNPRIIRVMMDRLTIMTLYLIHIVIARVL